MARAGGTECLCVLYELVFPHLHKVVGMACGQVSLHYHYHHAGKVTKSHFTGTFFPWASTVTSTHVPILHIITKKKL